MFKAARISKIKEILANRNQVDVQTLSNILGVSNVTIRSDLEKLEQEGFIYRTHGGATLREAASVPAEAAAEGSIIPYVFSDDVLHVAGLASAYIKDNEWIFLGGGKTCAAIAKALIDRRVQIVTNNLAISYILAPNPNANVIMIGGKVNPDTYPYLSGDLAINNINGMYFDKTFFGVSGVDINYGYSVSNAVEYNIFRSLRERSKEIIIVADASKCGIVSFMSIGSLNSVNTLISSENFPENYKAYYYDNNIKLFLSYDIASASVGGGNY